MIEIQNLTSIQRSLCDILWALDDQAEVDAFLKGLPQHLRQQAESMVEMIMLSMVDQMQDTQLADQLLSKILNKPRN